MGVLWANGKWPLELQEKFFLSEISRAQVGTLNNVTITWAWPNLAC